MTAPKRTPGPLVVDECRDAHGFYTIRLADGTPNGDTNHAPIATAYSDRTADALVLACNAYDAHLARIATLEAALERVVTCGRWNRAHDIARRALAGRE